MPMKETRVQSLDREDPLVKGLAAYSSILAWEVPWTEEPGGLQFMGSQGIRQNLVTKQQQQLEIRLLWFLLLETVYV